MQFAFIIFLNIILWAVFYLVISLKLERSASEFRSKRLRREMDDIMQEFNATAERNISILENRIAVIKKLFARTGILKQIDFNIEDDNISQNMGSGNTKFDPLIDKPVSLSAQSVNEAIVAGAGAKDFSNSAGDVGYHHEKITLQALIGACANSLDLQIRKMKQIFLNRQEKRINHPVGIKFNEGKKVNVTVAAVNDEETCKDTPMDTPLNIIQKDFKSLHAIATLQSGKEEQNKLDESGLVKLFESSKDRYSLVSDLHCKGYPVELLSRCSGIPMGEIKLVLNLNMS